MSVSRLLFPSPCLEDSGVFGSIISLSAPLEGDCLDGRILLDSYYIQSGGKDDEGRDNSESGGKVSFFPFLRDWV